MPSVRISGELSDFRGISMAEFYPSGEGSLIRFGSFQLDRTQGLQRGKEELRINPKSQCVLWELASRAGQLVPKEQLFRAVWADTAVGDSALTSCIQELRQAFRDDPRRPQFIETLHRRGYRFIAEISAVTRDEPLSNATEVQIIGRQRIISDILEIWSVGERGARQVLFMSGEPGIGKTTVVQHVLARVTAAGTARATWGQCLQHYGIGEPYQPLLEAIMRLCRQPGGADLVPILERYGPTWLAQLPALLDPERHAKPASSRSRYDAATHAAGTHRCARSGNHTDSAGSLPRRPPLERPVDARLDRGIRAKARADACSADWNLSTAGGRERRPPAVEGYRRTAYQALLPRDHLERYG